MASWFDVTGREAATAAHGNQGDESSTFTRPDSPPESSDDVLVTQTRYNAGGQLFETADAMGIVNRTIDDNAARTVRAIQNAVDDAAGPGEAENVTAETTYNPDGNVQTITADNPATGDQTTTSVFGVALTDSDLASNELLRAEVYPDTTDGADQVRNAYNRQGQRTRTTDQNGNVHEFDYDGLGRQTADRVVRGR